MGKYLSTVLLILSVLITAGTAGAATSYVPVDYPTIQAALDAATAGDTVIVKAGEYTENITIRKPLTLTSESGPEGTTIMSAEEGTPVITVLEASGVTLSGFKVTGATVTGIMIKKTTGMTAANNISTKNGYGITVYESHKNTLKDNDASKNGDYGIFLQRSHENTLYNNTANSNQDKGFFISYSNRNTIEHNNANNNIWNGITVWASHNNIIKDNLTLRNAFGIVLEDSTGNELIDNTTLPNIFIILPIFLIYIGILTYVAQKLIFRLIYRR